MVIFRLYRVSQKKLTPFKFKFAGNLLLEFDDSISRTITMPFNSHRELNLCFRLINCSFIWYALYTLRYLGNFCQITATMRLIWIWKMSVFFYSDPVYTVPDPYGHDINLISFKTSMALKFVIILQNLIKTYHWKSGKSKYVRKLTKLDVVIAWIRHRVNGVSPCISRSLSNQTNYLQACSDLYEEEEKVDVINWTVIVIVISSFK